MNEYKLGFHRDISNDDYHDDREYLSSSVIKTAYESLPAYKSKYIDGRVSYESKPLIIGTAVHTMVLEPENWDTDYIVLEDMDMRTKKAKEARADAAKSGKIVLSHNDAADISSMAMSVNTHPLAQMLFDGGEAELSFFSIDKPTGRRVKCRTDWIDMDRKIIIDLKTMAHDYGDFTHKFKNNVNYSLHYDLSAAMYLDIIEGLVGEGFEYYWVVVGKSEPFPVGVYKMTSYTRDKGRAKMARGMANILKAEDSKKYYLQDEIEEI